MRDEAEVKFSRALAKILQDQKKRVIERLNRIFRVIDWEKENEIMIKQIIPYLQQAFVEGGDLTNADILSKKAFIPSEIIGTILERAILWATRRAGELIPDINLTTKKILGKAIAVFYSTEGITIGNVEDMISGAFGPSRAMTIAVTEITRAYAEAGKETMKIYEDMGIPLDEIWNTNNDDLVCPICGPRHRLPKSEWPDDRYPPLHPNCRCWVTRRRKKINAD